MRDGLIAGRWGAAERVPLYRPKRKIGFLTSKKAYELYIDYWNRKIENRIAPKAKIPDLIKEEISGQGGKLVEKLRVEHIKPPPEDNDFSYITDIYLKWHGSSLYFCAQYCCRAPNCISPSFETRFARMEYAGSRCFNLSYIRHTGKWHQTHPGLSAAECLESIRTEPHFMP